MENLPNPLETAQKLIADHPNLFKDDALTTVTIAQALIEYSKKCADAIFNSQPKILNNEEL